MSSYLITGTSRGLGLALAEQLTALPESQVSTIFATARSDTSADLNKLISQHPNRLVFVKLDTTSKSSIANAVAEVEKVLHGKGLDVLINNAAVMSTFYPDAVQDMEDLEDVFKANVNSVHLVTRAFLPLLRQGREKKVVNVTSTLGSIAMASQYAFPVPAYHISKAALNMLTMQYATQLGKEGFTFIPLSPGWLKTDLGSGAADLPVEMGAKASLDVILNANKSTNGQFRNIHVKGWENVEGPNKYDGKNPPW